MKFVLDAMGGDNAPWAVVQGALQALKETPPAVELILIGDEELLNNELPAPLPSRITIHHSSEVVTMDDRAATVLKLKPNSSIVQGIRLVKDQKADAFISAGHTGAILTASLLLFGRISGVKRPALAIYIPTQKGGKIICDVGANPDAKPYHLLQFAIMASHYLDHVEGCDRPLIGLINIGVEPNKGSELYQETFRLLKQELPNFTGNIEGRHIFDCDANVLVCDGFVGNTLLKFGEGWIDVFGSEIKSNLKNKFSYKLGAFLLKPVLDVIKKKYDYEEHGGTPLLGVNGVSIISHGSSGPKSIKNSILAAKRCIDNNLIEDTKKSLAKYLGVLN